MASIIIAETILLSTYLYTVDDDVNMMMMMWLMDALKGRTRYVDIFPTSASAGLVSREIIYHNVVIQFGKPLRQDTGGGGSK